MSVNARDLIGESDNLHYIDATLDKNKTTASNSATEYGLMSYLGRLHYDYNNKYLITATFRRDGSSKFSSKNRWGNFRSRLENRQRTVLPEIERRMGFLLETPRGLGTDRKSEYHQLCGS